MKTATISAWLLAAAVFCPLAAVPLHAAQIDDPFGYFNVYSLKDISYTSSDFQGKAGAAGNASFSGFSLALLDQGGYALHAGGSVTLGSGSYYGSVEAGQNISASHMGIAGDLHAGNNISLGDGTVSGGVYAGGTVSAPAYYHDTHAGIPYSPAADLNSVSSYFSNFSTMVGAMGSTGSIADDSWGHLVIQALTGINVFSIDAAALNAAYTFTINGPSDAIVYINALGTGPVALGSTNWYYNGIAAGDVLLNYAQASSLSLSSSNNVNILAPFADTTFSSGLVTGNLIVGNLEGNGQVNLGHFDHGTPVPEPATFLLFGTGLAGMAGARIRKRAHG